MNIILGKENVEPLIDKFIVLELDSFRLEGTDDIVTAYCTVENVPLEEMASSLQTVEIHNDMLNAYRTKEWDLCLDLINDLTGSWGGEVDSFYESLTLRIHQYSSAEFEEDWDPIYGTISAS